LTCITSGENEIVAPAFASAAGSVGARSGREDGLSAHETLRQAHPEAALDDGLRSVGDDVLRREVGREAERGELAAAAVRSALVGPYDARNCSAVRKW